MKYLSAILIALTLILTCGLAEATESKDALPGHSNVCVVAFTSETCAKCQAEKAELEKYRKQGVQVVEIDVNRHPAMARRYGIERTPVYIVEKDGVEVGRAESTSVLATILLGLLLWFCI